MELNPQFFPLSKKSSRFAKKAAATQFFHFQIFSFPPIKTSPFPFSSTRFNNSCITVKKFFFANVHRLFVFKTCSTSRRKATTWKKARSSKKKAKFISTKLISNPEKRFMRFYGARWASSCQLRASHFSHSFSFSILWNFFCVLPSPFFSRCICVYFWIMRICQNQQTIFKPFYSRLFFSFLHPHILLIALSHLTFFCTHKNRGFLLQNLFVP